MQHMRASSCVINRNHPLLWCHLSPLMHANPLNVVLVCCFILFATRQRPFVTLNLHAITRISDFTSSRSLHNLFLAYGPTLRVCVNTLRPYDISTLIIWRNAKFDSARLLMFSQITSKFLGTKSRSSDGLIDETWFPFCFNSKFSLKLVILCTVTLYRSFSSLFE